MTDNERIAVWRGWANLGGSSPWVNPKSDRFRGVPPWDKGCGWWNGKNGLLAEIEKRGMTNEFVDAVYATIECEAFTYSSNPSDHKFAFLMLSPSQLTAALVKIIDDSKESDEKEPMIRPD